MKGLKNKMAVGLRIIVILSVFLLVTTHTAFAPPPGHISEFGTLYSYTEAYTVTPIAITSTPQRLLTLTVTPTTGGYLIIDSNVRGVVCAAGESTETGCGGSVHVGLYYSTGTLLATDVMPTLGIDNVLDDEIYSPCGSYVSIEFANVDHFDALAVRTGVTYNLYLYAYTKQAANDCTIGGTIRLSANLMPGTVTSE